MEKKQTRGQIVKQINNKICGMSKGIFSDEYWNGIKPITEYLDTCGHEFYLDRAEYNHDANGTPNQKSWMYKLDIPNYKIPVMVLIIAAGAGTVKDPLSRYDVVCYAS